MLIKDLEKKEIISFDWVKGIVKPGEEYFYNLFKLAYNLGVFHEKGQKVYSFLSDALITNGILTIESIDRYVCEMNFDGYKEEWSDFFMGEQGSDIKGRKVLEEIVDRSKTNVLYTSISYNDFSQAQKRATSNKGSQRQLKVNLSIMDEIVSQMYFEDVTIETADVAEEIYKFSGRQQTFIEAKRIREKYLRKRENGEVQDHILGEKIQGSANVFEEIKKERSHLLQCAIEAINDLGDIANSFSYEFLSKYDAKNFTLGKYCSCCAHLEGIGSGIVKTSILHPNCQNIVIRNNKGVIIAKSTIYVNKDEGYAVCNNIEINRELEKYEALMEVIYFNYKCAINSFATKYNDKHKENPLKIITIGGNLNAMINSANDRGNRKSSKIYEGLDFQTEAGEHHGDWQKEQYIVWENPDFNGRQK